MGTAKKTRLEVRAAIVALSCAATAGCASNAANPLLQGGQSGSAAEPGISVCDLKRTPGRAVGEAMRIHARYKTDSTRYEFFVDPRCPEEIMQVSYTRQSDRPSVKSFYSTLAATCAERGLNYCAWELDLTADVAMVEENDGRRTLEIVEVIGFEERR